jgi:hypothetical protein
MKAVKSGTKRIYYKYNTTLNQTILQKGGTYTDGMYSTSANGQALQLPVLPLNTANSWEFDIVYTYNGGGAYPCVIAPSTQTYGIVLLVISGAFYTSLGSVSSDTNICSETIGVPVVNGTTYYIKYGFDGEKYYFKYNTDGSDTYTTAWTKTSTVKVYSGVPLWLMNWGYTNATRWSAGTIDMTKFKVYVNDKLYLTGTLPEESTDSDYDYYKDMDVYKLPNINNKYYGISG